MKRRGFDKPAVVAYIRKKHGERYALRIIQESPWATVYLFTCRGTRQILKFTKCRQGNSALHTEYNSLRLLRSKGILNVPKCIDFFCDKKNDIIIIEYIEKADLVLAPVDIGRLIGRMHSRIQGPGPVCCRNFVKERIKFIESGRIAPYTVEIGVSNER